MKAGDIVRYGYDKDGVAQFGVFTRELSADHSNIKLADIDTPEGRVPFVDIVEVAVVVIPLLKQLWIAIVGTPEERKLAKEWREFKRDKRRLHKLEKLKIKHAKK